MTQDKEVSVEKASDGSSTRVDHQLERVFDDFFRRRWPRPFGFDWPAFSSAPVEPTVPRVDVIDKSDHLLVRAELPGITKDDIEVSVTDDSITIKGSMQTENSSEEGDYHRREIFSSSVSRTVTLPSEVDADAASAQLKDGLLEVRLPKSARAKRKRLDVQS